MNTLIIDENKVNRLYLRQLLNENFPAFTKIEEADSVAKALEVVSTKDFDLVILDIELPDGLGFEILSIVKDFAYVIIVSSHKEYAIQAFKHNVLDYILKPVNIVEFKNAVKRVLHKLSNTEEEKFPEARIERKSKSHERVSALMINFNNTYITIHVKDILYIKAYGKNSQIHMRNNEQYLSCKNLKEFESAMSTDLIRTHHSYLVNLNNIVCFLKETSHVKLNSGAEVPVSVRKKEELFKKFRVF